MTIFILLETILASMALAMSVLVVSLLAVRPDQHGIYRPLKIFFVANAYIEATSVLAPFPDLGHFGRLEPMADILSIPAFLLLAPALWFYVRGLTSETPRHLSRSDILHFVPFMFGVLVCSLILLSPASIRDQLIGDGTGPDTNWIIALTIMVIFIMLMWVTQVLAYIFALLRRITVYRARLKDVFASTEGRELKWIVWMIILLVATIFIVIPDMFIGFPEYVSFLPSVFDVILIWFLAVWGLRQMPGFVSSKSSPASGEPPLEDQRSLASKYEKSALTPADTSRIAEKIDAAMISDRLYLDPNLSLRVLSKFIAEPPNYVSQALNGHLGESFFDYINRWRIEFAKPLLATSDETVLNITYDAGFNSRSSFYKAFKRETGQTPTAYRNAMRKTELH